MRKTGILSILLALVVSFAGCGSAGASKTSNGNSAAYSGDERAPGYADASTASSNSAAAANTSAKPATRRQSIGQKIAEKISVQQSLESTIDTSPTDRKIIRNADLTLESETPEDAQREVTSIAERAGGFVIESQAVSGDSNKTKRDAVTMSVRVPSTQFGKALDEIRLTGSGVISEVVKGEDVTEEFIDIEARLRAKKALEQQFLEIMKRANNVDDAMNVQSQIADVRGEIEKIEGRKRFLENQSDLSTIKVRIQTAKVTTIATGSSGFLPRLTQAFDVGVNFALSFLFGLLTIVIAISPFAAFVGFPGYLIVRYIWKRQAGTKSVTQIVRDETDSA